jgi:hypothetical protein
MKDKELVERIQQGQNTIFSVLSCKKYNGMIFSKVLGTGTSRRCCSRKSHNRHLSKHIRISHRGTGENIGRLALKPLAIIWHSMHSIKKQRTRQEDLENVNPTEEPYSDEHEMLLQKNGRSHRGTA